MASHNPDSVGGPPPHPSPWPDLELGGGAVERLRAACSDGGAVASADRSSAAPPPPRARLLPWSSSPRARLVVLVVCGDCGEDGCAWRRWQWWWCPAAGGGGSGGVASPQLWEWWWWPASGGPAQCFFLFVVCLPCISNPAHGKDVGRQLDAVSTGGAVSCFCLPCVGRGARQKLFPVRVRVKRMAKGLYRANSDVCPLPCASIKSARQSLYRRTAKLGSPVVCLVL
jgi:hypothetical protein